MGQAIMLADALIRLSRILRVQNIAASLQGMVTYVIVSTNSHI